MNKSDVNKPSVVPISFVNSTGNTPTQFVETNNGAPTASYADILTSNDTPLAKLKTLYHVSSVNVKNMFTYTRPWCEFFDRSLFSFPSSISDVPFRLSRNIPHFYHNYILLSLLCCSCVLLINPIFSICMLLLLLFFFHVRSLSLHADSMGRVSVLNRSFTPIQLYVILLVAALLVFFFTNGSDVIFLILIISGGVVCVHGALRQPNLQETAFQLP
ncbi:unnamed protein product [Phytomonas sp. EM1]|nr:unnamed protein product [Phytomonas sp. EM1]|eukprot:CCW63152.1 unnamed protein product [Phytomonas sp. isolate EM1]